MNILENFVNKFSIEQKSASSLNYNENNNNIGGIVTKTLNTKSYLSTNDSVYMDTNRVAYSPKTVNGSTLDINTNNLITTFNNNSPNNSICHDNTIKSTNSSEINSNSKKTMRNMFSYSQIEILENIFEQTHYPDSTMREKLSSHLGINASRIQVWFQNRRAKFRKFDLKNKKQPNNSSSTASTTSNNIHKHSQQKSDEFASFTTSNYFEHDKKLLANNGLEPSLQYSTSNTNNNSNNIISYTSSSSSSLSSLPNTNSLQSNVVLQPTASTSSFNSDLILNDSLTNYLKNITHSTSQPSSSSSLMSPNDEYYNYGYHHHHHHNDHTNSSYGLQLNGYHAFNTSNEYQKQLYQNSNYQFYAAHYQNDNNF